MQKGQQGKGNRSKQHSPSATSKGAHAFQRKKNQDVVKSLVAALRWERWKGVFILGIPAALFAAKIMDDRDADQLQIIAVAVAVFAACNALYFLFHIVVPIIQQMSPGLIKLNLTQHEQPEPDDDRESYADQIHDRLSREDEYRRWHEDDHGHTHG